MKKIISVIFIAMFCICTFCACRGTSSIVGQWYDDNNKCLEIRSDGTYVKDGEYGSGSWKKLDNGKFELTDFYGDYSETEVSKDEYGKWVKYNGGMYYKDEYPQAKRDAENAAYKEEVLKTWKNIRPPVNMTAQGMLWNRQRTSCRMTMN